MRNSFQRWTLLLALGFLTAWVSTSPVRGTTELTRTEERIRRALVMLPYYSVFDHLTFRVNGPDVTLMGKVTRPILKKDAEEVVKRLEEIESIDNEIEVLPISGIDDRIRLAVHRALYYHPSFTRYALRAVPSIHIIVKDGDVALEGVVDMQGDKTLAGLRVNGVPGVFTVSNNLTVARDTK